ncbi:MAG TPA: DUF459 domain-containing protein [Nitriliruptorales bacterium]|nr:DUF459 domain-containing protein [Nitriliruptorales bacterium]
MIPSDHVSTVEQPDGSDARAPLWAAGHVIVAVVTALGVGAVLNARDLLATAERQPFGWQRDISVAVAAPIAWLAAEAGLDRPRGAIDVALGRQDDTRAAGDRSIGSVDRAVAQPTPPGSGAVPAVAPSPDAAQVAVATVNGVERGPVTVDDPLRLYIGGDSMVEIQFGTALQDLADETGLIEVVKIDYDRGSGLSRPDYVDWPARLAQASEELAPDAMVLYFGGNDAQPLKIDGVVHEPEAPEWQAEYRARVARLMDQLAEAGHHVYWMGLPIPQAQKMVVRFGIMNAIYQEEAATRDGITFVPVWDLFANEAGVYSEFLTDDDGDIVDMRLNDGIHLTTAGAYRAARPTIARIVEDFDIRAVTVG